MSSQHPNHVHLCAGTLSEATFGANFGELIDCRPISFPGQGHHPHVKLRFSGGISFDLTPATVAELARRLPEAIASMPFDPAADCSGAVWAGEGV